MTTAHRQLPRAISHHHTRHSAVHLPVLLSPRPEARGPSPRQGPTPDGVTSTSSDLARLAAVRLNSISALEIYQSHDSSDAWKPGAFEMIAVEDGPGRCTQDRCGHEIMYRG